MLEECGLPYVVHPGRHLQGRAIRRTLFGVSPNNRIPAIVDPSAPAGRPISVFESGATPAISRPQDRQVLSARGARAGRGRGVAVLADGRARPDGGAGDPFPPLRAGAIGYALARYTDEVNRLYGVMDRRLADREFLAGRYSIADMACVGWVRLAERQGQELGQFPHLKRWFENVRARPAVKRAFAIRVEAASAVDPARPEGAGGAVRSARALKRPPACRAARR